MNLIEVMERFPDQESCIEHLERIRWRSKPYCPHCGSLFIRRKKEYGEGRVGRWNCHDCGASFKVTWNGLSRHENTPSKMVFGNIFDCQREEKPIQLSTFTRFRLESKDSVVYYDTHTG